MKKTTAVLLVLVLCLSALAGCGGSPLSGRYTIVEMSDNGVDQLPRLEAAGVSPEEVYIELRDNGTITVAFITFDGVQKANGTFKVDANVLKISLEDGSRIECTIAGGRVSMTWGSARMVFEKEAVASSSASIETEDVAAAPSEQEQKLTAGDFEYIVTEEGRVRIDGYLGSSTTVEIPAEIEGMPVFMIDTQVFAYSDLEHITIPEGVEIIGFGCFTNCVNLTELVLPESLQMIYSSSFFGCAGLSTVKLPDGMVSLDANAFAGCPDIQLIYKGIAYTPDDQGEFPRLEKLLPLPF